MNLNWFFLALILMSGICLISSVFLMLWTFRVDRKIFKGEETSLRGYLIGAALTCSWVFLLLVSGILAADSISVYYGYGWTIYETTEIAIVVVIAVILVMTGSLWQYFVAGKFRELLYQKLKEKYKK